MHAGSRARTKDIFRRGSKTYFTSSLFFPKDIQADVFTLYAFVRVADDFVDSVPPDPQGFSDFERRYRAALAGKPAGDHVIDEFVELAARRRFEPAWTDAFLATMRSDLSVKSYETLADVERYMYGSAEVIGLYMAAIMGLPSRAHHAARMLGKAFQYINFLRDIDEDNSLGRTYIPQAVLRAHGLRSLAREQAAAHPELFRSLVRSELARYHVWQAEAEQGFKLIPRRYRVAIKTASDMYGWTASRIARDPFVVFRRKVKPSVPRLVWRTFVNGVRG